ncbi:MAG TPA: hypothetical protein VH062_27385 [Polyangiaceae bacterium]|jgi:hypothetical protein|nr:hypothetical protein [Polyangiaceae bacterium]
MSKEPKKDANRPAAAKPAAQPAKGPVRRIDGSGHVDPAHAARLLELSREAHEHDDDRGFVKGHRSQEAIAEEFGEGAVSNMTSGEDMLPDAMDENSEEETGGPFVETAAAEEFAQGTDESNIAGATREPFPKTSGG